VGLEVSAEHQDHLGLLCFFYKTEAPRNHIYHTANAHRLHKICNLSLANYVLHPYVISYKVAHRLDLMTFWADKALKVLRGDFLLVRVAFLMLLVGIPFL